MQIYIATTYYARLAVIFSSYFAATFDLVECRRTAWRFDLQFDATCGSTEFVALGYMLFDGRGAEKSAGRHFPKDDYKPFLYAQLDQTPDLSKESITVGLELRVESWNADRGPRYVKRMQISMLHVGETLKLRLTDIPLKNDTPDFTQLSTKFEVLYENFDRELKKDCYVDATYYLHGEVATSGYECSKTILVCRCDDGVTSQNCQLVPQTCFRNGAQYDRQTAATVCKWKMNHCCPEVDCPVEPLAYCLNLATSRTTAPYGVFVATAIIRLLCKYVVE